MEEAIGLSEVCSTIWCNLLCFCCFLFHLQVTKQVKGLQESVSDLNTTLQSSSQGSQTTALNQKRCVCPDFSRRYLCPDFSRQSCFRMWMFWKWRCKQRRRTAKRSRRQGSRNFKLHCNTCKYVIRQIPWIVSSGKVARVEEAVQELKSKAAGQVTDMEMYQGHVFGRFISQEKTAKMLNLQIVSTLLDAEW